MLIDTTPDLNLYWRGKSLRKKKFLIKRLCTLTVKTILPIVTEIWQLEEYPR